MEPRLNFLRYQLQVECYLAFATDKNSTEEVFLRFRKIVDMYILAGSTLEINIETAMRNKILEVRVLSRDGHIFSACSTNDAWCTTFKATESRW